MSTMTREMTPEALLALSPERYLSGPLLDAAGRPQKDLLDLYAVAAAMRLRSAEASPQEVHATFEALQATLPRHRGPASRRFTRALDEALSTVASMYQIENNRGIVDLFRACASAVRAESDIDPIMFHLRATVRNHAVLVAARGEA